MPRERSPSRDKAKEMYLNSKGEMKLKDIAAELEVLDTQIRKWKSIDKWDDELKGTLPKEKDKKKGNVTKKANRSKNKKVPIADEVKEVLENTELNDKQKLFCVIYSKRQNATKAYQEVYGCGYSVAAVNGARLLKKAKIKEQIDSLFESELNKEFLKKGLIQLYKDIAFSNVNDYLKFGKKKVPQWTKDADGEFIPVIDPNTGEQKIFEYNYVDLKESENLDTSIITEVSEGKDGIKIKLADKMKAMEVLSKLSNLLSDEEKIKLEIENKKLANEKLRADIDKITKNSDDNKPIEVIIKRKGED